MKKDPWLLISDKWNDPEFNLNTDRYPELHVEFENDIDIGFSNVEDMGHKSPDKAKSKYLKIKWKRSGNGSYVGSWNWDVLTL